MQPTSFAARSGLILSAYKVCDVVKTVNGKKIRERGGVVLERRTPNREVLGSIPTGVTVLCP